MLTREEADCLVQLIECSTEGNWPLVADQMVNERGYSPKEVSKAVQELANQAGVATPITEEDFDV